MFESSNDFLKNFLTGYNSAESRKKDDAQGMLSSLMYFGGAPSRDQATQLKDVLGFNWPSTTTTQMVPQTGPSLNFDGDAPGTGLSPMMSSLPVRQTQFKEAMGSNPLAYMGVLAKMKEHTNKITPQTVYGEILAKQAKGQPLSDPEQETIDMMMTGKTPWFLNNLDEDQQAQAAQMAGKIIPTAAESQRLGLDEKKLAAKTQYEQQLLELKTKAEQNLDFARRQGLIDNKQYREKVIRLKAVDGSVRNLMLHSLLSGDELPKVDVEKLYNISIPQTKVGLGVTKSEADGIIDKVTSAKPETQKALLQNLLNGYNPQDREFIFNVYKSRIGSN